MTDTTKTSSEPEMYSRDVVQALREENRTWKAKAEEHGEAARRAREEAASARERVIRAELRAAATSAGMIDLDGLKLADLSGVTLDEAGAVQGADAVLADLRERKPYLFGSGATPRNASGNNSSNPGAAPTPARGAPRHASDMSKEEFERELQKLIRR